LIVLYLIDEKKWFQKIISSACGGSPSQAVISQLAKNSYPYVPSAKMQVHAFGSSVVHMSMTLVS